MYKYLQNFSNSKLIISSSFSTEGEGTTYRSPFIFSAKDIFYGIWKIKWKLNQLQNRATMLHKRFSSFPYFSSPIDFYILQHFIYFLYIWLHYYSVNINQIKELENVHLISQSVCLSIRLSTFRRPPRFGRLPVYPKLILNCWKKVRTNTKNTN
jgi:hypothetical protein